MLWQASHTSFWKPRFVLGYEAGFILFWESRHSILLPLEVVNFPPLHSKQSFFPLLSVQLIPGYFGALEHSPKWGCPLSFDLSAGGAGGAGERAPLASMYTELFGPVTDIEDREIKDQRSNLSPRVPLGWWVLPAVQGSVFAKSCKKLQEAEPSRGMVLTVGQLST